MKPYYVLCAGILGLSSVLAETLPAGAKGSAISFCPKHGFHSFYQNMKTKNIAINSAKNNCKKIGVQKFQMTEKDARACCARAVAISKGCVAIATGQGSKEWRYYQAYGKWRIPTVLKALKSCEKDYFDCQVKMTTCVGRK